jgi:hypothetical protein
MEGPLRPDRIRGNEGITLSVCQNGRNSQLTKSPHLRNATVLYSADEFDFYIAQSEVVLSFPSTESATYTGLIDRNSVNLQIS